MPDRFPPMPRPGGDTSLAAAEGPSPRDASSTCSTQGSCIAVTGGLASSPELI